MLRRIQSLSNLTHDVNRILPHASSTPPRFQTWQRSQTPHLYIAVPSPARSQRRHITSKHDNLDETSQSAVQANDSSTPTPTNLPPSPQQPSHHSPLPPAHNPSPHNTLSTFQAYSHRTGLSPTSTTYLGTRYEYLTQTHLQTHLNFNLTRTGGRNDSGIDLLGKWPLQSILRHQPHTLSLSSTPTATPTAGDDALRVLVQCKRLSRSAGPNLIRELEGSFRGAPVGWRGEGVLGVMVCTIAATKGVRDAMGRSARGLVWVMLEEQEEERSADTDGGATEVEGGTSEYTVPSTRIRQFLYNAAAARGCGLEGVGVGMRYDDAGKGKEVQLLWQGRPIDFGIL